MTVRRYAITEIGLVDEGGSFHSKKAMIRLFPGSEQSVETREIVGRKGSIL